MIRHAMLRIDEPQLRRHRLVQQCVGKIKEGDFFEEGKIMSCGSGRVMLRTKYPLHIG